MKSKEVKINRKFVLILLVLVLMIVIMFVGIFARYMTAVGSEANGKVAVWHFDVKANGKELSTGEIDFAETITCEGNSVKERKLAPGTSGVFNIEVDTSDTEVLTEYDIKIDLENCPRNLKFYFEKENNEREYINKKKIGEKIIEGEKIVIEELFFTRCFEVNGKNTEIICWEWPFVTGDTDDERIINNQYDTNWVAKKKVTMNIIAIGQQILEMPMYLADVAQVGDYVNYNANVNEQGVQQTYEHTTTNDLDGCTVSKKFTTEDTVIWRVLSIDKWTKEVTLMAEEPIYINESKTDIITVKLRGIDGYKNAEDELNNIGSIYGHGKGAKNGRSINLDDVMQYLKFNPKTQYSNNNSSTGTVGGTRTYTSGTFIKGEKYVNEERIEYEVVTGGTDIGEGKVEASEIEPVTIINTYYYPGNASAIIKSFKEKDGINGLNKYNMFFKISNEYENKPNYWLASRCVILDADICKFYVSRCV